MSRPKPTVLLETIDKKTYKADQVLKAEAIWAVFYQGAPFNLKSSNILTNYPGPKYKKVSFSNPGHALNLAKKLTHLENNLVELCIIKISVLSIISLAVFLIYECKYNVIFCYKPKTNHNNKSIYNFHS